MKYFTKEWYELCESISLYLLLEEYFLKLYYVKLNDWINLQQQVALHMTEREKISEENTLNKPFEKEKAIEQYRKYYRKAVQSFDKGMFESIRFHDCRIINTDNSSGDLILHFDNTGAFTDINEVIFQNYNIIKQDNLLEDSWWL